MVAAGDMSRGAVTEAFAPWDTGMLALHEPEALTYLRREIRAGRPWSHVLMEAVGLWHSPCEVLNGQQCVYLIGGEAFDWLALAGRLLREVPNAVPTEDCERLLLRGELPPEVTTEQFRNSLGVAKYRAHLNFFYGVVVEEALWLAVEQEVAKEHGVRGLHHGLGIHDVVTQRLYGADEASLVRKFRRVRGEKLSVKFTLADWKEFTYWLFKQRLARWDAARVASDTRKGLNMLRDLRQQAGLSITAATPSP